MRLMFVGDISLGEHFFSFGHGPRTFIENGGDIFGSVRHVLSKAEFVVGNLEGPLSDIGYKSKDPLSRVFRGSPASIKQLCAAGVNILNLANNHSLQHGEDCFFDTLHRLKESGIQAIGLTDQLNPEDALILDGKDGLSIGLLAASDIQHYTDTTQDIYAQLNIEAVCTAIQNLSRKCNSIIVVLHWGIEGNTEPTDIQREIAKRLVRAGADVVIGHHPHVFFEIERKNNAIIAYSLGNFVFDLPWEKKMTRSGILDMEIHSDGSINSVKIWPVRIKSNGMPTAQEHPMHMSSDVSNLNLYYNIGRLRWQGLKKLAFFMLYLPKGDFLVKIRFLLWKLKELLH